mgnify:CR=1 FL=1
MIDALRLPMPRHAVNHETAECDLDIPCILQKAFEHNHLVVYNEVFKDDFFVPDDLIV